ncbi:MAG: nuclear transport factor 2 family protein [Burkholderiaceae bacterium]|nr:nuclear transport factor 2 family protein [Burkholderiaceae bacterium]
MEYKNSSPIGSEHLKEDFAQIRQIAARYLSAAQLGNSKLVQADFMFDARIRGYLHGAFVDLSAKEFFNFLDENEPATLLAVEIEAIDVIGTAASLRIDCRNWHGIHYTDFFILVKIDNDWQIAGKVFDAHENREILLGNDI